MRDLASVEPRIRMGGQASPSFHTLGIYTQLLHTVYCGAIVSLYPPTVFSKKDLPIAPTSDNIIDHLRRTQCMGLIIIPSIVQIWSHSQEAIDYLKTLLMVVSTYCVSLTIKLVLTSALGVLWRPPG